jgi:hypothetical protein
MEVGEGPNWGCSAKRKTILRDVTECSLVEVRRCSSETWLNFHETIRRNVSQGITLLLIFPCSKKVKFDILKSSFHLRLGLLSSLLPLCFPITFCVQSVGLLGRGISLSQDRYLHMTTQTHNKRIQTSVSRVGFEPTIPVFERTKMVHALDR